MARLAATAVLLLSLLAVASCRVLEAEPDIVVPISDEQSQVEPAVPQETGAAEAIPRFPTVNVDGLILELLPSHRRPCRHGFLPWARNHGLSHHPGAFLREARVHPAVVLPEVHREPVQAEPEAEPEAVAEPDPDTRPDTDGEQKPFLGEEAKVEDSESVKAWKGEIQRWFRGHGLDRHHHEQAMPAKKDDGEVQEQQDKEERSADMQLQHIKMFSRHFDLHQHHSDEEQEPQDKEEGAESMPVKLLRFSHHFHHRHGDEEHEDTTAKHHFHHHHHEIDSEVEEVEGLARRLSKAIMRRSFRRGGIGHHLHHHRAEEGGVRKWFKGFLNMNRI